MTKDEKGEVLLELFKNKPLIDFSGSTTFPSEEKIYTLAGIKRHFKSVGLSHSDADEALYSLQNRKELKIQAVLVYNKTYQQKFPYFYVEPIENLSKIVQDLENEIVVEKSNRPNPVTKTKRKKK